MNVLLSVSAGREQQHLESLRLSFGFESEARQERRSTLNPQVTSRTGTVHTETRMRPNVYSFVNAISGFILWPR